MSSPSSNSVLLMGRYQAAVVGYGRRVARIVARYVEELGKGQVAVVEEAHPW